MGAINQPDQHLDAQESPQSSAGVFEEILKTRYRLVSEGLLPQDQYHFFNFNQRLCCAVQNMFVEKFTKLGYPVYTGKFLAQHQRWTLLLYFLSLDSVNLDAQDIGLFNDLSLWNTGSSSSPLFIPRGDGYRVLSLGTDKSDNLYQNEFRQMYQDMVSLSGPYWSDDKQLDAQFLAKLDAQIDAFIAKYGEATQHFDFAKLQELANNSYMIECAKKLQYRELAVNKPYKMQSLKIEQKVINELLQTMSATSTSETVS